MSRKRGTRGGGTNRVQMAWMSMDELVFFVSFTNGCRKQSLNPAVFVLQWVCIAHQILVSEFMGVIRFTNKPQPVPGRLSTFGSKSPG